MNNMSDTNKIKLVATIFIALLVFTDAGQEVIMELAAMVVILGVGFTVTLAGFLIVDYFKKSKK